MTKKLLRKVLGRDVFGNLLRIGNYLTLPKPIQRTTEEQELIDKKTMDLSLYDFSTCPFCIKVRRFMHENNIHIEILDAVSTDEWAVETIEDHVAEIRNIVAITLERGPLPAQ